MRISRPRFTRSIFLLLNLILLSVFTSGQRCSTSEYQQHYSSKASTVGLTSDHSFKNLLTEEMVVIPVVIHVLYNTPEQNISDAQILSQIQSLNKDFRKLNADTGNVPGAFKLVSADAGIVFCLAKKDPNGNATSGIIRKYTSTQTWSLDDKMKFSASGGDNAWDSKHYLNIWVCNLVGRSLGYSSLPGSQPDKDGLVIQYNAFGTVGTLSVPFNKGRTATHEAGHWLGLIHLWGDANCGDDGVDDTPQQQSFNHGCPIFPHKTICSKNNDGDMFMNFMDFTDDACMNMFTVGQKNKMKSLFAKGGLKNTFLSSSGCDVGLAQAGPVLTEASSAISSVSLYPNPASSFVFVEPNSASSFVGQQVKIFDVYGNPTLSKKLNSQKNFIPIATFPNGIYFLQIQEWGKTKMIKFVKQ